MNKKELSQIDSSKISENDINSDPPKGPLNYLIGSITSFSLFMIFYLISKNIAIYFATHRPSNHFRIIRWSMSCKINSNIFT